jgi:peptidoglycan/xylan/chitin deacetylase (PgdA/CDA1 family)
VLLTISSPQGYYTNKLLTYLNSRDLKATFFLVGPRIISRPEIVVYEHMNGHELGSKQSQPNFNNPY